MQSRFNANFVALALFLIGSMMYSSVTQAAWLKQQRDMMGTQISLEIDSSDPQLAQSCADRVFNEFERIEQMMSTYLAHSELSHINEIAAKQSVQVSPELFELLLKSIRFSELSGGAFDISYASIGYRYDYRNQIQPDDTTIQQALPSINYRNIILKDNSIHFTHAGMRIDLGGIAKGYAVDRAIDILQKNGISSAIVTAGGDSRIIGDKNGRPWIIGIQHPRKRDAYALRIPLFDSAISTSGDYERYFLTNDERIHHIINPKTGKSAKGSWSASVIGPDATTTDALSTTLFILGAEKGIQLIDTMPDLDAIIIDAKGKVHYSSGLAAADQSQ